MKKRIVNLAMIITLLMIHYHGDAEKRWFARFHNLVYMDEK